mgnify:CR=1 FL=1|jgi:hypothetical protein
MPARILILDIETAPNLAYVWRFFKENVSLDQLQEHSNILSVAAKWLGEKRVYYWGTDKHTEAEVLAYTNKLLDEADIVVAHNGDRFDMAKIRGRSLVHGLDLPSPYKQIDTWKIAKREFGFDSNSLAYLADVLGCSPKTKHKEFPGFELWAECLKGNKRAWKELCLYNKQDVLTLEEIYVKIRPYARNHPSVSAVGEPGEVTCPKCGSTDQKKRGHYYTNTQKYQRYKCMGCGGWHRARFTEYPKEHRHILTVSTG